MSTATRRFATVGAFFRDTRGYASSGGYTAGAYVEAEGFRYRVVPANAPEGGPTGYHVITAGGVKAKVLPGPDGTYNFAAMNPAATGLPSGDDYPKLRLLLDAVVTGAGWYRQGPSIYFPDGRYYMGQTIELKEVVRLLGSGSGLARNNPATLVFAPDTTGIVVNRYNTLNGGREVTPTFAADACVIDGLNLVGSGADPTKHGIWLRARALVRCCFIHAFPGNGIHIVAEVFEAAPEAEGNANCFRIDTVSCVDNGGNGIYAKGGDANAGLGTGINVTGNGLWGIYDSSFLGNSWVGCHSDSNGVLGGVVGSSNGAFAGYGGKSYQAVPGATETQLRTTQPGTNAAVWWPIAGTNYVIPWTGSNPVGTFRQGGPYHSDNPNAACIFQGCYVEGGHGYPWLGTNSLAVGGFLGDVPAGAHVRGSGGAVGVNSLYSSGVSDGVTLGVTVGGSPANGDVLRWNRSSEGFDWRLRYLDGDWMFDNANADSRRLLVFTSEDTTRQFGTGAAVPYVAQMDRLALGRGANARLVTYGAAAPTTGAHAQGEIVFNSAPTPGGFVGWTCVTAGTPGVWRPFGAISA